MPPKEVSRQERDKEETKRGLGWQKSAVRILRCGFNETLGANGVELQMTTVRCCLPLCLAHTHLGKAHGTSDYANRQRSQPNSRQLSPQKLAAPAWQGGVLLWGT